MIKQLKGKLKWIIPSTFNQTSIGLPPEGTFMDEVNHNKGLTYLKRRNRNITNLKRRFRKKYINSHQFIELCHNGRLDNIKMGKNGVDKYAKN